MSHLIAARRGRPSGDPIFTLHAEATARAAKGERIVNATLGVLCDDDGALAILPTAARAVREVPEGEWAAYAPIVGDEAFARAVIADQLGGSPLADAAIAVATPGGTGALRHAFANFVEPKKALLTSSFYWGPYKTLADEADRAVATFDMFRPGPADAKGGDKADATLSLDALDRAMGDMAKADGRVFLVLNDPCHNPTGYSMHEGEWREVAAIAKAHAKNADVTILVDGAYAAYARDPAASKGAMLGALAPIAGDVGLLFAWSASKTFTHYGLRVGALVACVPDAKDRADALAALTYSSRGTWSNCNRGGFAAVTRLLADRDFAAACDAERETLRAGLFARAETWNAAAAARGIRHPRYEGGFFVTVFADDGERLGARLREKGIYVLPLKGAVRVGLCAVAERDVERIADAIAASK